MKKLTFTRAEIDVMATCRRLIDADIDPTDNPDIALSFLLDNSSWDHDVPKKYASALSSTIKKLAAYVANYYDASRTARY